MSKLASQLTNRDSTPESAGADAAGLAAFRVLFGLLMAFAVARFVAMGWVRELYVEPAFHFTFPGLHWVRPLPAPWIWLHFTGLFVSALAIAAGYRLRIAAAVFFVLFVWLETIDVALYLNHYYLVSLLALWLVFVPADAVWSPGRAPQRVDARNYVALRMQVAVVYWFAAVAKVNPDWLWHGEPMATWMSARAHIPVIGPLLALPSVALAMSWAGMVYDFLVPAGLLWRRTRAIAFVAVVVFHLTTWLLFPIGVFPWVMMVSATLFFSPGWPRRLVVRSRSLASKALIRRGNLSTTLAGTRVEPPPVSPGGVRVWSTAALLAASLFLTVQWTWPWRHVLYPGVANWTEQGYRFSWKVMLMEKAGMVEFRVVDPISGRRWLVPPGPELTPQQARMMSTQPDMIHEYALHLAERWRREHAMTAVEVYADVWVAWNGRASARLIDPDVNLAAERRTVLHRPWILSAPASGLQVR